MYDTMGMTADDQAQGGAEGFQDFGSFADIFKNMGFGGMGRTGFEDVFENMFGGGSAGGFETAKGKDFQMELTLDFMEAIQGVVRKVKLNRKENCVPCNGSGVKPGAQRSKCGACNGRGMTVTQRGPMMMQSTCAVCRGQGTVINAPCAQCGGTGKGSKQAIVDIHVPKGIDAGQTLRMAAKGQPGLGGGPPGDLFVKIKINPHHIFRRDG